jgi:hypothetical protein
MSDNEEGKRDVKEAKKEGAIVPVQSPRPRTPDVLEKGTH